MTGCNLVDSARQVKQRWALWEIIDEVAGAEVS